MANNTLQQQLRETPLSLLVGRLGGSDNKKASKGSRRTEEWKSTMREVALESITDDAIMFISIIIIITSIILFAWNTKNGQKTNVE